MRSLWGLSLGPAQPCPVPCRSLWEEGSRPSSAPSAQRMTQQRNVYVICPGMSERAKLKWLPSHPPQRPTRLGMSTPSPGPSQVSTLPGRAHLLLSRCQFCLELSLHSTIEGPGPGILPSGLRAELLPAHEANPQLKAAEGAHARPTKEAMGLALKGWWGRAAREADACRGGLPWPSAQSMSLQQPSALSFKPATDSPAYLVMSVQGHEAVKAAIYTLAHNNHSPGRNDTLEGGN